MEQRSQKLWRAWQQVAQLLRPPPVEPARQLQRLCTVERDVLLPVRGAIVLVVAYAVLFPRWSLGVVQMQELTLSLVQKFFAAYVGANVIIAWVLLNYRRFSLRALQWVLWMGGLLDGALVSSLVLITTGFESLLFWLFPVMIVRNALTFSLVRQQLTLNFAICFMYLAAGLLYMAQARADAITAEMEAAYLAGRLRGMVTNVAPPKPALPGSGGEVAPPPLATNLTVPPRLDPQVRQALGLPPVEYQAEPFVLRVLVLFLLTFICYGLQILLEKQRLAEEEARELAARQGQIDAAGRLSAEIAHQLKNPLGIINNAAFNLQRLLSQEKEVVRGQIGIIREEVERIDRIVTELMGYAKLADARVERLDVVEELERAVEQVFPAQAGFAVEMVRRYPAESPQVVMQRGQLAEIFVNLLQNAREAMEGKGRIELTVQRKEDGTVVIEVADSGPGIPRDRLERIFEAYYSTKPRGTGLGLAIVKHTLEVYGGRIRAESELGKGARFIITLPPNTFGKRAS
ncbi:ATP-binding protein [Fontisphaera persica]|uniref:sensor histidine kinase n=1 Tax=Fontisphaera persica TaxID=2974023 RepID=UPI0024BFD1C5|nr:ATP-binding protein [Fontisphaera persica]WCJ58841.1 ATP-binding protein [Fontisphaera persica]